MSAHGFHPVRVVRFLRENLVLLAMVPALIVLGALIHEMAHAVSVTAEGGAVIAIRPGGLKWLPQASENRPLIALAPAVVWTTMALGTAATGRWLLAEDLASRVAVMLGFFLPVADASFGAAGLFCRTPGADWTLAFRGFEPWVALGFGAYVAVLGEVGFTLFRRCWGEDALSGWEYTAVYLTSLAVPWALQPLL